MNKILDINARLLRNTITLIIWKLPHLRVQRELALHVDGVRNDEFSEEKHAWMRWLKGKYRWRSRAWTTWSHPCRCNPLLPGGMLVSTLVREHNLLWKWWYGKWEFSGGGDPPSGCHGPYFYGPVHWKIWDLLAIIINFSSRITLVHLESIALSFPSATGSSHLIEIAHCGGRVVTKNLEKDHP